MNGTEPKIEIFKPFGEAFELMKRILFQPFELKKWLVIGFAAFLAHLGAGFNYNYNYKDRSQLPQELSDAFHQIPLWIVVVGAIFGIVLIIIIAVVFAWLRARGRFIFIDCIVKNRAAIVQPWREFREQGNRYFLFSLLIGCSFFLFAALLSLPFLLPIVRGATFPHLHDVYLISVIVLWAVVIFLLVFAWALVAHLMVVLGRARTREHRGQLRHNLCDLLHRGDSVRWHCDFAASLCGASFVFIVFSAAIRIGLRRLGDIAAARSTGNSAAGTDIRSTTTLRSPPRIFGRRSARCGRSHFAGRGCPCVPAIPDLQLRCGWHERNPRHRAIW